MIVIEDNRIYAMYVRTNRRIKWTFAEYGGRYETIEQAINSAKKHFGNTPFEYSIENMETDEITTGFINWNRK